MNGKYVRQGRANNNQLSRKQRQAKNVEQKQSDLSMDESNATPEQRNAAKESGMQHQAGKSYTGQMTKLNAAYDEAINSRRSQDDGTHIYTKQNEPDLRIMYEARIADLEQQLRTRITPVNGPDGLERKGTVVDARPNSNFVDVEKMETDIMAKKMASMVVTPLTSRNQTELVEKAHASMSDAMRHVMPTKELQIDMMRGVSAEQYGQQLSGMQEVLRAEAHEVRAFTRSTDDIIKIDIQDTNLHIVTSKRGSKSVIIEDVGSLEVRNNLDQATQFSSLALQMLKDYMLTKPCVLDIGGNVTTRDLDDTSYTTDGLDFWLIVQAINAQRTNDQVQRLLPSEIADIRAEVTVYDGEEGTQKTSCFDGLIKSQIYKIALDEWSENIIDLKTYINLLRPTIPRDYKLKEYLGLEYDRGKVYHKERINSLGVLIRLEARKTSRHFLGLFHRDLMNMPVEVRSVSAIQASIAPDNRISTNTSSVGNQFLAGLDSTGNNRVRAILLMCCIFTKLQIEITFNTVPTIIDMIGASFVLLFFPDHSISDDLFKSILSVMASFLQARPVDWYRNHTIADLQQELITIQWPFYNRYTPARLDIEGSPVFSNGEVGSYDIPFNVNIDGIHVFPRMMTAISEIASRRWRTNNATLGTLLSSVHNFVTTIIGNVAYSHVGAVSRIRGMIPNELAEALNYTDGSHEMTAAQVCSYICSLGDITITPEYSDRLDAVAEERIGDYTSLAIDINRSIALTRSLIQHTRPNNTRRMNYTDNIVRFLKEAWKDDAPMISPTLDALLSIASANGKEGYKTFLIALCNDATIPPPDEPILKIVDRVRELLMSNKSAFGVTDEICIYPPELEVIPDARFANIFRNCPFVAAMPERFERIHYRDFMLRDDADSLIVKGVIIYGAPFNFKYTISPENINSRLNSDVLTFTQAGVTIGTIDWTLGFYDGPDRSQDIDRLTGRGYKVAIKTPVNIKPLSEYNDYKVQYTSASSQNIYIKEHTFVYSRA